MDAFPPEILDYILSFCSLKDLGIFSVISKKWRDITEYTIIGHKMIEITKPILVNMVKHGYRMSDTLIQHLPDNLKDELCVLYAYLGDTSRINSCLKNGARWTEKAVSYAYCREHLHLSAIYGYAGLDPAEIISLYDPIGKHTQQIYHLVLAAIREQKIDLLKTIPKKYLNHDLWHKIKDCLIECDNLDIINWFLENIEPTINLLVTLKAVKKNRLDIIKRWNFLDGLPRIDVYYLMKAFKYGRVHMLKKYRSKYSAFTLSSDIQSLPIIKWREYTRHYDVGTMIQLLELFPSLSEFMANSLAMNGYLESLKHLIHFYDPESFFLQRYDVNIHDVFIYAIGFGQLHVAEYILNDELLKTDWMNAMRLSLKNVKRKSVEWLFNHWNPSIPIPPPEKFYTPAYVIKKKRCPLDNQKVRYYHLTQPLIEKYQHFYNEHIK